MSKFNISKLIKAILRIAVGIIQFAVSLLFIIAIFSGVTTVMNFATTLQPTTATINFQNSNNVSISVPFYFNNSGLYDINDLNFTIDVDIHNITDSFDVIAGSEQFSIPARTDINTTLVFDNGVLDPNLVAGMALNSTGYNMTIFASISLNYCFNLVPLRLNVTADIPLGE
ncbi:MAG: hypothetical protein EU530_01770 [Promethearchaeota archaeon]|nr:MAG: hypothetical protein EU530_01770 [Candidatus Lokiarchaeota archaeon]